MHLDYGHDIVVPLEVIEFRVAGGAGLARLVDKFGSGQDSGTGDQDVVGGLARRFPAGSEGIADGLG